MVEERSWVVDHALKVVDDNAIWLGRLWPLNTLHIAFRTNSVVALATEAVARVALMAPRASVVEKTAVYASLEYVADATRVMPSVAVAVMEMLVAAFALDGI
jgi:hypothetical protein